MTPADRARLIKLLGMLGSEHDGERAAAASAVVALVRRLGLTWDGLVVASAAGWSTQPAFDAEAEARKSAWMRAQMDGMMNADQAQRQNYAQQQYDPRKHPMGPPPSAQESHNQTLWDSIFGGKR